VKITAIIIRRWARVTPPQALWREAGRGGTFAIHFVSMCSLTRLCWSTGPMTLQYRFNKTKQHTSIAPWQHLTISPNMSGNLLTRMRGITFEHCISSPDPVFQTVFHPVLRSTTFVHTKNEIKTYRLVYPHLKRTAELMREYKYQQKLVIVVKLTTCAAPIFSVQRANDCQCQHIGLRWGSRFRLHVMRHSREGGFWRITGSQRLQLYGKILL